MQSLRTCLLLVSALVAFASMSLLSATGASAATKGKYDYLIAPPKACPGQLATNATVRVQVKAMQCLIDYTRKRARLPRLAPVANLNKSSVRKASDIRRCQDFSHTACGRSWDYWIGGRRVLFSRWAENLAWGSTKGGLAAPRAILRTWLYSPTHRANLLNRTYNTKGVGLVRGNFKGYSAGVWVHHFGTR